MMPESIQELILKVEEATKSNSKLHLIGAIDYNGQTDITQACKNVANKVKDGLVELEDINKSPFEKQLQTKRTKFPSPDLLIPGGFVDKLVANLDGKDFISSSSFQKRKHYDGHKY